MAENIKIIVQEEDQTRPRGSGVSSDIVYVPGLASEFCPAEYQNKPLLCSTIDEFEAYFGSEPYKFPADEQVSKCAVKKGDYDKSYIYAKELINAGLTVLYENITPDDSSLVNLTEFETLTGPLTKVRGTKNVFRAESPTGGDGSYTASVTFSLEGLRKYGGVSVLCKAHSDSDITVDLSETDATTGAPAGIAIYKGEGDFTITGNAITWEDQDPATATFTVNFVLSGAGLFSVSLVEGTNISETANTVSSRLTYFYANVGDRFDNLKDKNEYTVKYLTLGGYPSFNPVTGADGDTTYPYAAKMLDCAASRNDVVALIDHYDDPDAALGLDHIPQTNTTAARESIYKLVNNYFKNAANTEFGAMFTPWGNYTCVTVDDETATLQAMPASFGYLLCLAKAIKTSPNWLAMAGVSRGIVPNLQSLRTNKILSNVIAENYQPKYGDIEEKNVISINAITNVKPYGLTIWGNRTLKRVASKGTVATNFLNTRNMISDIKKLSYNTAKSLMFEQESDTLWLRFKSGVSPLLDQLKSGHGISDYKLIKNTTKYNGNALTRGEMSATIKIFPLYAVEYFEITVVVSDNDVAVS